MARPGKRRRPILAGADFGYWAAASTLLGALALLAAAKAVYLPTFHLDGAFQTASGLYRLADGQLPGRDFFPYLGVGPVMLLFPAFLLAGADLAASVFASWFVVFLGAAASVGLVWFLVAGRSWLGSLVAGLTLVALGALAGIRFGEPIPGVFGFALEPGNSLRPIRALIPYLALGGYLWACSILDAARYRMAAGSVIAGLALSWSNDFGIPTAAAILLLSVWEQSRGLCLRHKATALLLSVALAVAAAALSISVLTGGHLPQLLRFNLADVAGDQWWYYGPYSYTSRVYGAGDLLKLVNSETWAPLLLLAGLAVRYQLRRDRRVLLLAWLGLVTFGAGALASVGGHLGGYFGAFNHWMFATALAAAAMFVSGRLAFPPSYLRVAAPALSAALLLGTVNWHSAELRTAERSSLLVRVPELGGLLPVAWAPALDFWRSVPDSAVIFEEYWGIASALKRAFPPVPVDSVIHALGEQRPVAKRRAAAADYRVTTRESLSPRWQSWNISQNYWFYRDLLSDWVPVGYSPTTVIWARADAPRELLGPVSRCRFDDKTMRIYPGDIAPGPYEMQLDYRARKTGRALLLLRTNVSFGAGATGRVSLDPRAGSVVFPVMQREAGTWFDFSLRGDEGLQLEVTRCEMRRLSVPADLTRHVPIRDFPRYAAAAARAESTDP